MRAILAFVIALVISSCGPIVKPTSPLWKFVYYNNTNSIVSVRVTGLGDHNWPDTSWPSPSPPPDQVFVAPNSMAFFYWHVPPKQLFVDSFHSTNVLALGTDYGYGDFELRVQ